MFPSGKQLATGRAPRVRERGRSRCERHGGFGHDVLLWSAGNSKDRARSRTWLGPARSTGAATKRARMLLFEAPSAAEGPPRRFTVFDFATRAVANRNAGVPIPEAGAGAWDPRPGSR